MNFLAVNKQDFKNILWNNLDLNTKITLKNKLLLFIINYFLGRKKVFPFQRTLNESALELMHSRIVRLYIYLKYSLSQIFVFYNFTDFFEFYKIIKFVWIISKFFPEVNHL